MDRQQQLESAAAVLQQPVMLPQLALDHHRVPIHPAATVALTAGAEGRLSPPRLEIRRVCHSLPLPPSRHPPPPPPMGLSSAHSQLDSLESLSMRARAVRDVNQAHVRDMHGNL